MLEFESSEKKGAKQDRSKTKHLVEDTSSKKSALPPVGHKAKPFIPTYREMPTIWRPLNWLVSLLMVLDLCVLIAAYFYKGELPHAVAIKDELLQEPIQGPIKEMQFDFEYADKAYTIEPVAEYQIAGLVVTHNFVGTIFDAYHDADAVDIKDLCLVWGDNLATDNFRQLKYSSETWACIAESTSMKVWREFKMSQLSNNHLLSASSIVREKIRSVRIGDQVMLKGMLVNYYPAGSPELKRNTSITRTDTCDGACEVLLVQDINILARATPGWYTLWSSAIWLMCALVVFKLIIFFTIPLEHYKKFNA